MQLNLSNQEVHEHKTENDEDNLSQRRKSRKDKPVNKLPKINQMQKGISDEDSDIENNINTSINLPKINQNLANIKAKEKEIHNPNKILNSKTLQTKKNQLNTNNSNASLQNNRK